MRSTRSMVELALLWRREACSTAGPAVSPKLRDLPGVGATRRPGRRPAYRACSRRPAAPVGRVEAAPGVLEGSRSYPSSRRAGTCHSDPGWLRQLDASRRSPGRGVYCAACCGPWHLIGYEPASYAVRLSSVSSKDNGAGEGRIPRGRAIGRCPDRNCNHNPARLQPASRPTRLPPAR